MEVEEDVFYFVMEENVFIFENSVNIFNDDVIEGVDYDEVSKFLVEDININIIDNDILGIKIRLLLFFFCRFYRIIKFF